MNKRTWVEIDTNAISKNIKNYRKILPKNTKLMSVIKANAYGHDLNITAKTAIDSGIDYLSVFNFEDALILRKKYKNIPILVLKQIDIFDINSAIKSKIDITISSLFTLNDIVGSKDFKKSKNKLRVHLKVDTGLSRQGFLIQDLKKVVELLKESTNIELIGLYTHFAGTESRKFNNYTKSQVAELLIWQKEFNDTGFKFITHASATSGVLLEPSLAFDMVRLGIGTYGLWPSSEMKSLKENDLKLYPVLSWKTVISEIKTVPPNTGIGYDVSYKTQDKTKVAVLPIGYWDGLPRAVSNNIDVLINGTRCRLLGRVMMNMCIVDIGKVKKPVVGNEVIIIGKSGKQVVSAEELAICGGTINYEIVTRINPEIKRIAV